MGRKSTVVLMVSFVLLACRVGLTEQQPTLVSVAELVAHPQNFNRRLVEVEGFLVFWTQQRHSAVVDLYADESEVDRPIAIRRQVLVIPSDEMAESRSRITHKYVKLTGTFYAVRSTNGCCISVLKEVQHFVVSSTPSSP